MTHPYLYRIPSLYTAPYLETWVQLLAPSLIYEKQPEAHLSVGLCGEAEDENMRTRVHKRRWGPWCIEVFNSQALRHLSLSIPVLYCEESVTVNQEDVEKFYDIAAAC